MLMDFDTLVTNQSLKITGIIHIGAWVGEEYERVYARYPNIQKVVFFEPDPETYDTLYAKLSGYANVACYNKALGPSTCEMEMYKERDNGGQSSSLLKPALHTIQYPGIRFTEKITVSVEPLDKYQFDSIYNFINIDVQGFEKEVFKGAHKTLANIDYIMSEVNRAELYENCCRVEELDEFLFEYGFVRVETVWENYGRGTWGDALYIKSK